MHPFSDKVVLITGGSSGIGLAAALRLAKRGARLVLAARNPDTLAQASAQVSETGAEVLAVPTDVSQRASCAQLIEATVARFGQIDILICSAGVSMRAPFAASNLEVLEHVIQVNLLGTLYMTHGCIPHVVRTGGSLVALSSLTGKRGTPWYATYGASKFAVQGLYQSLRLELAHQGVHVGVLAPGFVDTPLRQHVLGPQGEPWSTPPPLPFRLWPVETCVDCLLDLLESRRAEVLLPRFVRPLLALDEMSGGRLGDRYLGRKFGTFSQEDDPENPRQK